jgi:hypothetical protein
MSCEYLHQFSKKGNRSRYKMLFFFFSSLHSIQSIFPLILSMCTKCHLITSLNIEKCQGNRINHYEEFNSLSRYYSDEEWHMLKSDGLKSSHNHNLVCKIVLLNFVHCLNYTIMKLRRFGSWILFPSTREKWGKGTESLSVGAPDWARLRPMSDASSTNKNRKINKSVFNNFSVNQSVDVRM